MPFGGVFVGDIVKDERHTHTRASISRSNRCFCCECERHQQQKRATTIILNFLPKNLVVSATVRSSAKKEHGSGVRKHANNDYHIDHMVWTPLLIMLSSEMLLQRLYCSCLHQHPRIQRLIRNQKKKKSCVENSKFPMYGNGLHMNKVAGFQFEHIGKRNGCSFPYYYYIVRMLRSRLGFTFSIRRYPSVFSHYIFNVYVIYFCIMCAFVSVIINYRCFYVISYRKLCWLLLSALFLLSLSLLQRDRFSYMPNQSEG